MEPIAGVWYQPQNIFKFFFLTTALAALSPLALSQEDGETKSDGENAAIEEVVVYGIRGALENALAEKRLADNIVEIINAEDVGKLPDQNLAEVLENITGVQIDRNQGVGSTVSIRGSDQNRVEINGRGTTPAEDARGGISFEDLPAELIAAVKVVKVPTANMVEGSLGGTVDLKTYRPLRIKKPIRALNVTSEYAQNRDSYTPSYSGTFSHKMETGRGDLGFVLGATFSARDVREDSLNVRVGPRTNQDLDGDGTNDPYLRPQFSQQFNAMSDRENLAINGSLEWQASDSLRFFFDGTYTDAEIVNLGVYTALGLPGARAELDHLDTAVFRDYTAPNGVTIPIIVQSQIDGLQIRSTNASSSRYTESSVFAIGSEWSRDNLTVTAELSDSQSDTFRPNFGLVTQFQNPDAANINSAGAGQRVNFFYDALGPLAYGPVDPSAHDFLDTDAYAVFVARDREDYFENSDSAQRIDVTYDTGGDFVSSLQFGLRLNSRKSERDAITLSSATWPGLAQDELAPFMTQTPTDMMDFNSGASYLDSYLVPDARLFVNPAAIREAVGLPTDPDLDQTQSFSVSEDTTAAYVRVNFDSTWGDWPVRGNVGVRLVETTQVASGRQIGFGFPPEGEPLDVEQKYIETLPSLSLVMAPSDELLIRFGYAKILRRPDFGDLSPTVRFPANNNPVTQGNPELKPTTADQYDLSFEYYFRKGSLLSAGVFFKDIDGTIGTETAFDAIFNPNATGADGSQGSFVDVIRPTNVKGGEIKGVEVALQHNFDNLPGFLSGLGTILNYTYQEGERDLTFNIPGFLRDDGPIEFPLNFRQLSKNSYNVTLFYEQERFEARLRYTYRDAFLRFESRDIANGFPLYQDDRGQLNGNFAFNITDNFTLTLSGINLTKERNDETGIFADGPVVQMRDSDRRVILGLRARF